MLILDYPDWIQSTLSLQLIPKAAYEMTPVLSAVDKLLDDEIYEEPIIKRFKTLRGRPTVPVRVYIRMMFLKHYCGMSYEDLSVEVMRNLMYRVFCHIPLEQKVPDATALMKITTKYGEETITEINQRLLQSLISKKLLTGRKVRVDTTVVEANILFPTDAGLLHEGVKKLTKAMTRIKKACGESARYSTKQTEKIKEHMLSISKILHRRTEETLEQVREITGKMSGVAREVVKKAKTYVKRLVPETDHEHKIIGNLHQTIKDVERVISQSDAVNRGIKHIKDRLVSYADPDARPIVKGKLGKKTEFGYKLQVQETENGFVSGYQLYQGNPCDKELVEDSLKQHLELFHKPPREYAADRGYYDKNNESLAIEYGVKNVCIPKIGKKSKERTKFEGTRTFKRLKRWRGGIEGRISCLKRKFGLRRSMLRGYSKTKTWAGFGVFAHNLRKAALIMG